MKRTALIAIILAASIMPAAAQTFKQKQLRYERVRAAFTEKEEGLKSLCRSRRIPYPPAGLFIRILKKENALEVWARDSSKKYVPLKDYNICSSSGDLGPKRQRGDLQVPEGFYHINDFNPHSNFHLSLGVSYPNRSDQILKEGRDPGGAIYIHGSCVTIGCVPITDDKIKELYVLAVEARSAGQAAIPVHIFPSRLDSAGMARLETEYGKSWRHLPFWRDLAVGYRIFEAKGRLPAITIDRKGKYICR
jgi:murein L,D-transpeptidase YafK